MIKSDDIERLVTEAGFDLCGITRAEHLDLGELHFRSWLERGYGGELEYLHRNQEVRFDPSIIVEGGRTVVVCATNYKSDHSLSSDLSGGVGIASYALMRDYHKTLRRRLKVVLRELQSIYPDLNGRLFVDSAPLLEKELAVRAGLGWIGRQSLLVTPQYGTFILLAELVIDQEVDRYNDTIVENRCGACRRCIDACPTNAINDNLTIDTRRCIACRTIEVDDGVGDDLAGWIFGCDICQSVCPHNRHTPIATHPDMLPIITPPTREEWLSMNDDEFDRITMGTPLKRSSLDRIKHFLL